MIFDLHSDLLTSEMDDAQKKIVAKNISQTTKACVLAYWTTKTNDLPSFIRLSEINNLYFAVEDMNFFNYQHAGALLSLKPLYCGLTWNYDNAIAGGAFGYSGITKWGKEVVRFLNNNDIAIDGAHLNTRSFYDVIEFSKKFLVSHTAILELKRHKRNINKNQLIAIKQKGGIVGITPVNAFLKGQSIRDYVETIDFVLTQIGEDFSAIGSDFYGTKDIPDWLKSYDSFEMVKYEMEKMGYKTETIDKIFYKNTAKFFMR